MQNYRVRPFNGSKQEAALYSLLPPFDVVVCAPLWPDVQEQDDEALAEVWRHEAGNMLQ